MISHSRTDWPQTIPPIRVIDTRNEAVRRMESTALLAAPGNANVLLTGERGVNKEAVARYMHAHSDRSSRGFATIRCEGLAGLLFESTLFGHVQGSFPGADRDKPGLLESLPGGTVFLDEVGALSVRTQVRLLHYLETGRSQRIGGHAKQIDPWLNVRLIVSTSTNLADRVDDGLFLNDLLLRLSVHRLRVPPDAAGAMVWRRQ
jgi:DNA-binding NtrC family response regulator